MKCGKENTSYVFYCETVASKLCRPSHLLYAQPQTIMAGEHLFHYSTRVYKIKL